MKFNDVTFVSTVRMTIWMDVRCISILLNVRRTESTTDNDTIRSIEETGMVCAHRIQKQMNVANGMNALDDLHGRSLK